MADVTEVSQKLVDVISAALYPNTTASPSAVGFGIKVYAGWPDAVGLETDLKANIAHVTIWPMQHEKVTFFERRDNGWKMVASDGTTGTLQRESRRQTREFKVTVWANCHDKRDQLAGFIDALMSGVYYLSFADNTRADIHYINSVQVDSEQKQGIYRRDITYAIDYPTMQTQTAYNIKTVVPTYEQAFI